MHVNMVVAKTVRRGSDACSFVLLKACKGRVDGPVWGPYKGLTTGAWVSLGLSLHPSNAFGQGKGGDDLFRRSRSCKIL